MSWVGRELKDMTTVVDVASKMEKIMAFLVEAGFTHEKLLNNLKPTKDDQTDRSRRVRMQLVMRNFLQRALKGAFPEMESYSYSYFREAEGHGGTCLSLPALGVILATRQNKRPMEASVCANQNGVVLNDSLRIRMEYAWAYAKQREDKGDFSRTERMLPRMSTTERDHARSAVGEIPQKIIDKAQADMSSGQAPASSRRPQTQSSSRPSTKAEPKSKKKPRRQSG